MYSPVAIAKANRRVLLVTVVGLLAVCWTDATWGATRGKPLPKFAKAKKVITRYFEALPSCQPGGIIAQSEVEPIFQHLKIMGWQVPDRRRILKLVPEDNHFLVQQLRTPKGRKFMARISKHPLAYDRLDRLSRLRHGRRTIRELIRGPDGHKMIEYMTTTSGGKDLGKMLSKAPKGVDFNKPTGRIYTVKMLLDRLKESYKKTQQAGTKPMKKDKNPKKGTALPAGRSRQAEIPNPR